MNTVSAADKTGMRAGFSGGSILIVDDDVDFADGLADILKINSYEVKIASSIKETLASIDRYKPDIALIDLKLGIESGIDLIGKLKQHWDTGLVCIVITAYADVDTAMRAIREGADNYLQKPIRKEAILAELRRSFDKILLKRENESIYRQLCRNEKLLNEAQRIAQLGSWEHNLDSGEMIWSDGLYNIMETSRNDIMASPESFLYLVHPEDRAYVENTYSDAVSNLLPYEIEHRIQARNKRVKFVRQQCKIISDNASKTASAFVTVLDITDRKLEEITLQNIAKGFSVTSGEKFFQALTKHIGDTLGTDYAIVGSLAGEQQEYIRTVAVYNRGRFLESITCEIIDTPFSSITGTISKSCATGVKELFPNFILFTDMDIDSYSGSTLLDSRGNTLGVIVVLDRYPLQNIKRIESLLQIYAIRAAAELERLRYEKFLKQNEEKFRSLIEHGPDGIVMINPSGVIDTVNRKLESMSGYRRAALLGKNVDVLIPGHYCIKDIIDQIVLANENHYNIARDMKVILKCKDGKELPVEINLNPLVTENGKYTFMEIHDISERIKSEQARKALEEELFRAQKLEAIGQLTGGIAHDFNNILTSILGYVRLALRYNGLSGNEKLTEYLVQIRHGGERAAELVKQMLAYSRNVPEKIEIQEIRPVVINTLKLLRPAMPGTIDIKFIQVEEGLLVKIDAAQFEQMIMNLCINARDAMKGGGNIDISTKRIFIDSLLCDSCHKYFSGHYVCLSVHDTGGGITDDQIQRIFDPFYSTKDATRGSGLGLSMVHGAMHSMNGHILVDSIPGEGSTFNLVFPALVLTEAQYTVKTPDTCNGLEGAHVIRASILVIDDEPAVAGYLKELLGELGYEITVFNDGDTAYSFLEENEHNVDLVITDQTMKGISGIELSKKIYSRWKDMPVIIMTGFCDMPDEKAAGAAGIKALLRKPVDETALINNVNRLIQSKAAA